MQKYQPAPKTLTIRVLRVSFILFSWMAFPCWAQPETVFYPEHCTGGQFPQYSFGYTISIASDRYSVSLFNAKGEKLYSTIPTAEDRSSIRIVRGAVAPSGKVVLAGTAQQPDGRQSGVLVFLDQQGKLSRVVKRDGFGIQQLKFTSDSKLWALGVAQAPLLEAAPASGALRIYSAQGLLEKELLPIRELPKGNISVAEGIIIPTDSGLAVYLQQPKTLFQFSADGTLIKTTANLPLPDQADVHNMVSLPGERFALDAQVPTPPDSNRFGNQLFLLSFDGPKAVISPISKVPKEAGALLGTDDKNLLLFHARVLTKVPLSELE